MKKLICGITMCITVCSQLIFPQIAFAETKVAVEKAGEAFVAGMTETAEAEEVLSEEELRQQIVDFALQFEGNPCLLYTSRPSLAAFLSRLNGMLTSGRRVPENLPDITTGLPQNGQEEAPVLSSATISPPQDWHM